MSSISTRLRAWLRQPSTISGIGIAFATVSGLTTKYLSGDITDAVAAGGVVAALVHLVLNDNSTDLSPVEQFVQDAAVDAATGKIREALPQLFTEGLVAAQVLTKVGLATSAPAEAAQVPAPAVTVVVPATPAPAAPAAVLPPPLQVPAGIAPVAPVLALLLILGAGFGLAACATVPPVPQDQAQAVYLLEGDYAAALSTALAYEALPPCGATAALCASPKVEASIRTDAAAAWSALQAAQSAATASPPASNAAQLQKDAATAIAAFASVTSSLKVS